MTKRSRILSILASSIVLGVLIISCKKDSPIIPFSLELISGGDQTAEVLETLKDSVVVLVKDQKGHAFAGAKVNFKINEGSVSNALVTTDVNGSARVTWTLGKTVGVQTLSVTVSGLTGSSIKISATGNQITVTDYDNNTYNAVVIGNQVWIAENLKATHYANGEEIPTMIDQNANGTNDEWMALGDNNRAYCYYNENSNGEKDIYGTLYTFAAATNGGNDGIVQGICPTGWHLPSLGEWNTLLNEVNGVSELAGNPDLWNDGILESSSNFGKSDFFALPGGCRDNYGNYYGLGIFGQWWTSTEDGLGNAFCRFIRYNSIAYESGQFTKSYGLSVRCIKD